MNRVSWLVAVLAATTCTGSLAAQARPTATATAAAYLAAMAATDLDAAEALFAEDSLIFETGGVEGTWHDYRRHHIGPELAAIVSFEITRGEPRERQSADGTMAWVAWSVEYRIELNDGRVINSRGTVSFVLEGHEQGFRIHHLHWSSRRKPMAEAQ